MDDRPVTDGEVGMIFSSSSSSATDFGVGSGVDSFAFGAEATETGIGDTFFSCSAVVLVEIGLRDGVVLSSCW